AEDHSASGHDADRALTSSGRDRVRDVARELARAEEAPLLIVSSPLVRALQTAEIVAATIKLDGAVETRREIAPGGDALALVRDLLAHKRKRVMVVGHEPDLSHLVMSLVQTRLPLGMQKAMVVSVSVHEEGEPRLRFVFDPKTLVFERPAQ